MKTLACQIKREIINITKSDLIQIEDITILIIKDLFQVTIKIRTI